MIELTLFCGVVVAYEYVSTDKNSEGGGLYQELLERQRLHREFENYGAYPPMAFQGAQETPLMPAIPFALSKLVCCDSHAQAMAK